MRCPRLLVAGLMLAALSSCRARPSTQPRSPASEAPAKAEPPVQAVEAPATADPSVEIARSEQRAAARDAARECDHPIAIYQGSIAVDASDYLHPVERGDDFVDVPIDGLDRVFSSSTRLGFTLDYPFERPFAGVVTGEATLRRAIDAIRAGFRTMYEGTTQRDIPGMYNKDVTGPYGRAFHVIGDLAIEQIVLCDGDTLMITIGS